MSNIEAFYRGLGVSLSDPDTVVAIKTDEKAPKSMSQINRERLKKAMIQIHQKRKQGPPKSTSKADQYIEIHSKSTALAFILALLLGPLGSVYGSLIGGIVLIIIAFMLALADPIVAMIISWPAAIILATAAASAHNAKVRKTAELNYG